MTRRLGNALAALLLAGLATTGCDTAHTVAPQPPVAPVADSPAAAVKVLEWGFNNRNVDAIAGLLPEDFSFVSAELDSAGNTAVEEVWSREDLLATLNAMFYGDTDTPAANRVQLQFDANLIPFADGRQGRSGTFHRAVRTSLDCKVDVDQGDVAEAFGHLLCYVTRGDSAMTPGDLVARGVHSDSTRWWIDRIEDETIGVSARPGFHTTPARVFTFGEILRLWHHGPVRL